MGIRHYEIHKSKELWEDPEVFRPERFLNPEGSRVENKGKVIPFGHGKCAVIGGRMPNAAAFNASEMPSLFREEILYWGELGAGGRIYVPDCADAGIQLSNTQRAPYAFPRNASWSSSKSRSVLDSCSSPKAT